MKHILTVCTLVCYMLPAFAQPSNDDPCNAITLTVDPLCTFTTYTTAGATATSTTGIPAPGCANTIMVGTFGSK